jgi:hypothetical protein
VGDDPRLDVEHIPVPFFETTASNHRERDVLNKFKTIISSPLIGDEFVLMCDDLFILQPVDDEELKKAYGRAEVTNVAEYARKRRGSMDYKRVWQYTYEWVTMERYTRGLPTYDWECHLPRYLKKDRLRWIFEKFDLNNNPKLIMGLHDGYEVGETELIYPELQSDLWTHRPGMDFDKELSRKYLNIYDDVIIPEFIGKMETMFP